ncbi:MAG: hypothetical protein DME38_00265 [Verrucomicrobia bacterium]|nr:MAG: hypothetical protein DME38_00265 [Verrucomicrobiota bacterium]
MLLVYLRIIIAASLILIINQAGAACVWKVTSGANVLYLGGSIHALKSSDYPLPAAYNRAFDASDRVVFEVNHVDPRTYDYLRRVFGLLKVPETKFARYRPWFLSLVLQAPALHGMSETLGVEEFLIRRARANSKPASGLESAREHADVFLGLTDRQGEAMLLMMFLPTQRGRGSTGDEIARAWRRGDADTDTRIMMDEFRNFPSLAERFLTDRNRKWIPKIERYLQSEKTYFVVAGAAHMGGPNGIVALLRARGYHVEQL